MSEIMLGVLNMPDELFWSDDQFHRAQHNAIRKEAAREIEQLRSQVSALQAEVEGLRKDAARYRWLREDSMNADMCMIIEQNDELRITKEWLADGDALDEAIDSLSGGDA